jgi:excisionase family DNA binding protein
MKEIQLVSASEAARRLRVHHKTVSRLMRLGNLKAIKIANRWLIEEKNLQEFSKTYVGRMGRPKGWSPKGRV